MGPIQAIPWSHKYTYISFMMALEAMTQHRSYIGSTMAVHLSYNNPT